MNWFDKSVVWLKTFAKGPVAPQGADQEFETYQEVEAGSSSLPEQPVAEVLDGSGAKAEVVDGEVPPEMDTPPLPTTKYSRAFENLVEDSDDIVGLLAYSLYKESVRQEARRGGKLDGPNRNPTQAQVSAFRSDARRRISSIAENAIETATPDIEQNAVAEAIKSSKSEIVAHISNRTSVMTSLFTNIAAWLITLAIAGLVIFTSDRSGLDIFTPEPKELDPPAAEGAENEKTPSIDGSSNSSNDRSRGER